ncbi:cytochrome b/b6 domain-containing protein [Sphingomonas tabacisoli]|uniref:Cytochrome b/b6 domain-containing protein n=1 Tax=Sphingomonas tabacisoli TaxID=2249466 RepID=A0ABW4I6N9_9SPHN
MARRTELIYRHKLATRIWHWLNALTIVVLLMSGAMIFNAHPRLYWGQYGANFDRPWLQISADARGGYLKVGDRRFETDGVLGRFKAKDGSLRNNAFPYWATIPSNYDLAHARRWHLAFALLLGFGLLGFMLVSLFNRHFRKDLTLRRAEIAPAHVWHDVVEHLKLRFHNAEDPGAFNILQKLSYIGVIFVLIPLVIFTGLTMSPGMDAAWGWLLDLFGGRQSARSIHFIAAALLLLFIVVHLVLVLLSGPINGVRGMVTGWLRVPAKEERP